MKTIRINETEFEVTNLPYATSDRFQVNIKKGVYTIETILDNIHNIQDLKIYDDGTLAATYKGYNKLIALTIIGDLNNSGSNDVILSIELENSDLQDQINKLQETIERLQKQQSVQNETLQALDVTVTDIADTNTVALDDLGNELSKVSTEQASQAQAIDDLGNELSNIATQLESSK